MLRYVMLCYAMLCYVTLLYVTVIFELKTHKKNSPLADELKKMLCYLIEHRVSQTVSQFQQFYIFSDQ